MSSITRRACSPPSSPSSKRNRATSSQPPSTLVRFLVISDTHDTELSSYPACDVLLHCGDLTEDGSPESIRKALQSIGKIPAELKLVIAGNHEISLDEKFYLSEGGREADVQEAKSLMYGTEHEISEASKNGITFLDEGSHKFTLKSGASFKVYASPYTPAFGTSAFQYLSQEDRFNPESVTPEWAKNISTKDSMIPEHVDIVMTHGPAKYILDAVDGRSAGCEHLRRAIARTKPSLFCFGHIHKGYGAQRISFQPKKGTKMDNDEEDFTTLPKEWVGKNQAKKKGFASLPPNSTEDFGSKEKGEQTLCINAAIVDETGEPGNMPWVVDLKLLPCVSKQRDALEVGNG